MTMSRLGMAHSAPSMTLRSSEGTMSPPAIPTVVAPIRRNISSPIPEDRNFSRRRSSRLFMGRLSQPKASQKGWMVVKWATTSIRSSFWSSSL